MSNSLDYLSGKKPAPFIIYAMPRSRTTWLSSFLSYDGWTCEHDAITNVESLDDICTKLAKPKTGICETGLGFAASAMYRLVPRAKVAVIRRDPVDIEKSMRAKGWTLGDDFYARESARLDRAANIPGAITINYDDLGTPDGGKAIFEHCLQQPFEKSWWEKINAQKIEGDLSADIAQGKNRLPFIEKMNAEANEIMAMPTIQNEDWDTFYRDAHNTLFLEHYEEAGPIDRLTYNPNFKLAAKAYKLGMLQITTARSRGRLVGYLICQIEHHMEDQEVLRGIQIPWFISKPYRGPLAFKMHRFMRQSLKDKGVKLMTLRSGVRGVGHRLDPFYERLGAKDDGHMFSLYLED